MIGGALLHGNNNRRQCVSSDGGWMTMTVVEFETATSWLLGGSFLRLAIIIMLLSFSVHRWLRRVKNKSSSSASTPRKKSLLDACCETNDNAQADNSPWSFQLMVDGCNGPIRFAPHRLLPFRVTNVNVNNNNNNNSFVSSSAERVSKMKQKVPDWRSVAEDVLSLLRPDSSSSSSRLRRHRQSANKKLAGVTERQEQEHSPQRLNMLPLLDRLLHNISSQKACQAHGIWKSVAIIFDGVSQSKRGYGKPNSRSTTNNNEEHGDSDATHAFLSSSPVSVSSQVYQVTSDIQVEITGFYEEADNVIVDRVQTMNSLGIPGVNDDDDDNPCYKSSRGIEITTTTWDELLQSTTPDDDHNLDYLEIVVVHRTHLGPGKNRRVLQSFHLLRPESVACLYLSTRFSTALQRQSYHVARTLQSMKPNTLFRLEAVKIHPSQRQLQLGATTLLTTAVTPNHNHTTLPVLPFKKNGSLYKHNMIVVTDDVFLRQRVVNDAKGFVMTFDQFWVLLAEQQDRSSRYRKN